MFDTSLICVGCGLRPSLYSLRRGAPRAFYKGRLKCNFHKRDIDAETSTLTLVFGQNDEKASASNPLILINDLDSIKKKSLADIKLENGDIKPAVIIVMLPSTDEFSEASDAEVINCLCHLLENGGYNAVKVVNSENIRNNSEIVRTMLDESIQNGKHGIMVYRYECLEGKTDISEMRAKVQENCMNCTICYEVFKCPAISFDFFSMAAKVDQDRCNGCLHCVDVCPAGAIGAE